MMFLFLLPKHFSPLSATLGHYDSLKYPTWNIPGINEDIPQMKCGAKNKMYFKKFRIKFWEWKDWKEKKEKRQKEKANNNGNEEAKLLKSKKEKRRKESRSWATKEIFEILIAPPH